MRTTIAAARLIQRAFRAYLQRKRSHTAIGQQRWYSMRDRKIAALTIQLWWRQCLFRRYGQKLLSKKVSDRTSSKQRKSSQSPDQHPQHMGRRKKSIMGHMQHKQQMIYGTGQSRVPKPWVPSPRRPKRPPYLRLLPPPSITSFKMAINAYQLPMQITLQDYMKAPAYKTTFASKDIEGQEKQ